MGQRIDPSRVRMLIELGQVRSPEAQGARRTDAEVLIRHAWDAATLVGRMAFETWRKDLVGDTTWSAVTQPSTGGPPPAFLLVRDQVGDPDDPALRGQIVALEEPAWAPLRQAFEVWDTATIGRWLAADGWRVPVVRSTTRQAGDPPETAPRTFKIQGPGALAGAPSGPSTPKPPTTAITWEQAAVGGAVGGVVIGSIFYMLGKRRGVRLARALGEGT